MTENLPSNLPGVLGFIADEIGDDVARRLAGERGGRVVYIPKTPKNSHQLSRIVGMDAAIQLAKLLGHGNLLVPCGPEAGEAGRRKKIVDLWQQGLTQSQIAAEVDVHTRTVERVVAKLRSDEQLNFRF